MRIAVAGASGFLGRSLVDDLQGEGHEVRRLVRGPAHRADGEISWDPAGGRVDGDALRGTEAALVLSGENIASGRWTPAKKRALRESRTLTLGLLSRTLAGLDPSPRILIAASAIGYYGDRGDEVMTEESPSGKGFFPELVTDWEAAAGPARDAGIRVVHLRLGLVLSGHDRLLGRLVPLFRLGLGGPIGSGRQWMSWISLRDTLRIVRLALENDKISGPINCVAPNPVTNAEFTHALGRVVGRPTLFRAPAFALRMLMGEMADETALASTRVLPRKLENAGFTFEHPEIEPGLRSALGN
jgi:uncharacterized protein (TIGR01777 family)